jgi:hypothetical protein
MAALRNAIAKAKFSTLRRSYPAYAPADRDSDDSVDDKTATTLLTIDGKSVDYEEDASRGPGADEFPTTAPKRLRELVGVIWNVVAKNPREAAANWRPWSQRLRVPGGKWSCELPGGSSQNRTENLTRMKIPSTEIF